MRDIILILAIIGFVPLCFRYPAAGVMCWAWLSLMNPQRQVYGLAFGQQFNMVIAVATLLGWLISSERKRWTPDFMPKLMAMFVLWATLNSFFSLVPEQSWPVWDQTVRAWVVVFLAFFIANTSARIHGLIWTIAISLGYYGVKGGLFTIVTGGNFVVMGPEGSMIGDNNNLALALVMNLPLLQYLRLHTRSRALQSGIAAAIFLEIIAVLGSHSRGAAVALGVVALAFCLTTRRKILYGVFAIGALAAALSLMPDSYFHRLDTIGNAETDSSFMGRVNAWQVAIMVAIDHFPFGAGFYVPQVPFIFHRYLPSVPPRAAHSIYFQVLGEQGFIGLALYIPILVLGLRNATIVMRQIRGRPDLLWAYDLASMTRVALVGFCIGGAALSLAYFDGFLLLIALMSTLREITERALRVAVPMSGAMYPIIPYPPPNPVPGRS